MKFNKLLVGLMGFPLLLTSCNTALTYEQAKKWVEENYSQEAISVKVIPCISWDFSGSNGREAIAKVYEILYELREGADEEGLQWYVIPIYEDMPAVGHERLIPYHDDKEPEKSHDPQTIVPLTTFEKGDFSKDPKNDIYKVNNGCFNVTYKNGIECFGHNDEGEYNAYSTSVRVYNKKGYCTDFGYKANKYMDKDNTVKFKFLIHFEYEDDPID